MNQPLFSPRSGDPMDKTEVIALVEREVRLKRHGSKDDEKAGGSSEGTFSGSFGATTTAEAGIDGRHPACRKDT